MRTTRKTRYDLNNNLIIIVLMQTELTDSKGYSYALGKTMYVVKAAFEGLRNLVILDN